MGNFSKLNVYQRANVLFPRIYKIVRSWDKIDQREIGSQLIRSANSSIHANVAEGSAKSKKDFVRFINIALGSCDETRSHINDVCNIGLIDESLRNELVTEYEIVGKQLTKLKQSLQ